MTAYDPDEFVVQRRVALSGALGEFVLGGGALGSPAGGAWVVVPSATVTWASDYTLHDNREGNPPASFSTLVIGSETGTVDLSFWDDPGDILFPGDVVRASYGTREFLYGTVESVTVSVTADPAAAVHGAQRRIDVSAAIGGHYASMLSRRVCWDSLPQQSWEDRIRLFVDVD